MDYLVVKKKRLSLMHHKKVVENQGKKYLKVYLYQFVINKTYYLRNNVIIFDRKKYLKILKTNLIS